MATTWLFRLNLEAPSDAELFNFATDVDSGQRAEIRIMQKMLGKP
jgi:hypothetical protein